MADLELATCPMCRQKVAITYRDREYGWASIARHLDFGHWCPQTEAWGVWGDG